MTTKYVLLIGGENYLGEAVNQHLKGNDNIVLHAWKKQEATVPAALSPKIKWGVLCFTSCEEAKEQTQMVLQQQPSLFLIGVCSHLSETCRLELLKLGMQYFVFEPDLKDIAKKINKLPLIDRQSIENIFEVLRHPNFGMKEEKKMQLLTHLEKLSPKLCKILVVFWNNLSFTVENIATFLGSDHNTVCHQIRIIYTKLGAKDKQDLKAILQQTECVAACQLCIAKDVCVHKRNEFYER